MQEVDKILGFLFENIDDTRISINKRMKYGHRHYYLSLYIDSEPSEGRVFGPFSSSLSITIDNRNKCIEMEYNNNNIIIEDDILLNKWNSIFEEYINETIKEDVDSMLDKALSDCFQKNLHREYKMKKIFKDEDESI